MVMIFCLISSKLLLLLALCGKNNVDVMAMDFVNEDPITSDSEQITNYNVFDSEEVSWSSKEHVITPNKSDSMSFCQEHRQLHEVNGVNCVCIPHIVNGRKVDDSVRLTCSHPADCNACSSSIQNNNNSNENDYLVLNENDYQNNFHQYCQQQSYGYKYDDTTFEVETTNTISFLISGSGPATLVEFQKSYESNSICNLSINRENCAQCEVITDCNGQNDYIGIKANCENIDNGVSAIACTDKKWSDIGYDSQQQQPPVFAKALEQLAMQYRPSCPTLVFDNNHSVGYDLEEEEEEESNSSTTNENNNHKTHIDDLQPVPRPVLPPILNSNPIPPAASPTELLFDVDPLEDASSSATTLTNIPKNYYSLLFGCTSMIFINYFAYLL